MSVIILPKPVQLEIPGFAQRWEEGDEEWVGDNDPIDTWNYEIADVKVDGAKLEDGGTGVRAFVERHHYAHKYVAARRRFGLYHRSGELRGVAIFSEPYAAAVTPYFPDGPKTAPELGRLVLLPSVRKNGESWFVGECFRRLRREGMVGVISFCDPEPRRRLDGTEVKPGHWGAIYRGLSARFEGRATKRMLRILPDGTTLNERDQQKTRKMEKGWTTAVEDLTNAARVLGKPLRKFDPSWSHEERCAWLDEAKDVATTPLKHPGNLRFVWGFTKALRKALPHNPKDYLPPPQGRPAPRFGRRARALQAAA